ncbi:hypothetical protein A2U01_0069278, partial [Trifolium medium]|nr:hypothetical protein [Trifolium medium]
FEPPCSFLDIKIYTD